jgi:hypothetical protein
MPLNEQEKEQFDLLVQSFQDGKVSSPDSSESSEDGVFLKNKKAIRNRYVYGVLLFLLGLGALVGSVALQTAWIGVAAFLSMLGGSILIYGGYRYSRFYGDIYVPIRLPWSHR